MPLTVAVSVYVVIKIPKIPLAMHKCYFKIHVPAKLFSRFRSKAASTHCSVCPSIWELACWRFSLLGELKKSIENKIIFFTKRLKDFVERFFLIFFSFFYLDEMGWQWGEGWDFISTPNSYSQLADLLLEDAYPHI